MWPNKEKPADPPNPEAKPPAAPSAEELLAKMGELLSPIKEWQEQTSTRLSAIEERTKPREVPATPPDKISVLDDEDGAFNQRLGGLAVATILANARITENEVLSEFPQWSEYFPQIKKHLAATDAQYKVNNYDQYVRNVIKMVVGEAALGGGLRRDKNRFVLEDASGANDNNTLSQSSQEDRDFLNFHVTTGKGKVVTRGEYLKRIGIDVSNPEELKKVRETWSKVQVVS